MKKEKKILSCIKEVLGRYASVYSLVFTTFDFDPVFFADHVISYLMYNEHHKVSTVSELNETNEWIKDNHVCVCYDRSMLRNAKGAVLTIPNYPIKIENGVFHPKVIAIYGKEKGNHSYRADLIVSSANLTVNGYGRNIECFSHVEINNKPVAESLAGFLSELRKKHQGLQERSDIKEFISFLKYKKRSSKSDAVFFWNMGGGSKKGKCLTDYIKQMSPKRMQIISPYFDKDGLEDRIIKLFGDGTDSSDKPKITIYPSKDGGHYNITKKEYRKLKKRVAFREIEDSGNTYTRFLHAKIIWGDDHIIIGSYNFTSAALEGRNAEAALIYVCSKRKIIDCEADSCEADSSLFLNEEDEVDCGDEEKKSASCYVTMTVDWKNRLLNIKSDISDFKENEYIIRIGDYEFLLNKSEYEMKIDNRKCESALIGNKFFELFKNGESVYSGMFNELNWDDSRPEISCANLGEAVAEWFESKSRNGDETDKPLHTMEYNTRQILKEDGAYDILTVETDNKKDIFDNYYYLASAMGHLIDSLKYEKKNGVIYKIFSTNANSMIRMLNLAMEYMKGSDNTPVDPAYYWFLLKYLDRAYDYLPGEAKQFVNYKKEKKQFRSDLDVCIEECRRMIYAASDNNRIESFLEWIDEAFDEE